MHSFLFHVFEDGMWISKDSRDHVYIIKLIRLITMRIHMSINKASMPSVIIVIMTFARTN